MNTLKSINLAIRFLLELAAVAAVTYWGFTVGNTVATKIFLGIGAPLLVVGVWAVFVAPKAVVTLPRLVRHALGLVVLILAAAALAGAGQVPLAILFGIVVLLNAALLVIWEQ